MKQVIIILIFFLVHHTIFAQHEHHMENDTIPSAKMKHTGHDTMMNHSMHQMSSHSFSRNLPMNRNGSGTSWLPDASPMYMIIKSKGATNWMLHGNIFLRYTNTDIFKNGSRGSNKVDAPNWIMAMVNHKVGNSGLLNATAMLSADRLTEGGNGYPLLFQSGETFKGQPLVDRQHPHDLFSALSIGYTHMVNKNVDVFGYFGYPGEPALGAPAFMHRVSSMNNPDAPLGHHWQDATHITFGVATLGVRYKNLKLEGSSFTGREPDEERYGFDKLRFDSYSYRISYNASKNWAFQFSQGFINAPEVLEPGIDVKRTTASVLYAATGRNNSHYNAALVWGYNDKGAGHREHSVLLEDNHQFGKNAMYSRYEFVQKSAEELNLEDQLGHETFNVHVFSLGYNRTILENKFIGFAVGAKGTINFPDKKLKPLYGDLPIGGQIYLQLRPALHRM
ncbi:MAG: hypothetical protein JNL23_08575 [Chitinophagaceae bacterium]|nr:hypothetical protein [Chitinophagaceae bacterium]